MDGRAPLGLSVVLVLVWGPPKEAVGPGGLLAGSLRGAVSPSLRLLVPDEMNKGLFFRPGSATLGQSDRGLPVWVERSQSVTRLLARGLLGVSLWASSVPLSALMI